MEHPPTKPMLDMAKYDDREILMDQTLLHFSQELDARGIEHAIREEFEVFNGDLPDFIQQNLRMYAQQGATPAEIRAELEMDPRIFVLRFRLNEFLRTGLVGFIGGGIGTLLFSRFAQANMPPAIWSLRYALLVLVALGAHLTLRQLHRRYETSYVLLASYTIAAAVGAVLLLKWS